MDVATDAARVGPYRSRRNSGRRDSPRARYRSGREGLPVPTGPDEAVQQSPGRVPGQTYCVIPPAHEGRTGRRPRRFPQDACDGLAQAMKQVNEKAQGTVPTASNGGAVRHLRTGSGAGSALPVSPLPEWLPPTDVRRHSGCGGRRGRRRMPVRAGPRTPPRRPAARLAPQPPPRRRGAPRPGRP